MKPDTATTRWMRDASDELAVANGCWFDERIGQWVVDWMEEYLRLYEGDGWAGKPFECKDWQYEATMRLFGWQRPAGEWEPELGRNYRRRFKRASIWIAKKNKKSPTVAAWMAYHLCGDGVMGQKIFPGAKDGAQIRQNVVQHFHEMIRQSPELSAECKINKSTATVYHEPTKSSMYPLSSDNISNQKSKEGLNGSIFIDEVHVVDAAFIRRISRAGISRPEPLHVEVSTAGDDMDSYGYERFRYAEGVISGEVRDDTTLALVYAAPQNLSDADLEADPLKYGRMANPAMGHTVKESEFLEDYRMSKATPRGLADFKMYRLNIWQSTATPWLDMAEWDKCPTDAKLDPTLLTCGGLDLSSKKDFTAWAMAQEQRGVIVARVHCWITERRAREHSDRGLPIYEWERDGWLTICPGARIDYADVESAVKEDCKEFQVECVAHDPWNAERPRQVLEEDGITMVEVTQSYKELSDPTKTMEVAVLAHEFDHGGNPVLRWMARNCAIKPDTNDNYRPLKPDRMTYKAIDGVVATIMAIGQLPKSDGPSIYEQEGALFL